MTSYAIECPCGLEVKVPFRRQRLKGRRCPECERWLEIHLTESGGVGLAFVDGDPVSEKCSVYRVDPITEAEVERLR